MSQPNSSALSNRLAHAFYYSYPAPQKCQARKPVTAGVRARNEAVWSSKYLGRALWRNLTGCYRRSRIKMKMHCMKLLGQRLSARDFGRKVAEIQIRGRDPKPFNSPRHTPYRATRLNSSQVRGRLTCAQFVPQSHLDGYKMRVTIGHWCAAKIRLIWDTIKCDLSSKIAAKDFTWQSKKKGVRTKLGPHVVHEVADLFPFRTGYRFGHGLVPLTFRSLNSFMRPFVQMPRGFYHPAMSACALDYKIC